MAIKIQRTDKDLSSNAGLILFDRLLGKVGLDSTFHRAFPCQKSGYMRNLRKIKQLTLAFQAGAECLDDLEQLKHDEGFRALCDDKVYSPKALGDMLRSFNRTHCREFNRGLINTSYRLRQEVFPKQRSFTLDIDSTENPQHGKKMEGAAYNYKGTWGLDTIQAFDEYGFQYWSDVRPGNTHTAHGALEIIHEVFNAMPESMADVKRNVRADSGYCKLAFFNACAAKKARFVVCMRKLMYKPLISQVTTWQAQDPKDKDRILFSGGRECEVGEVTYRSQHCPFDMRAVIIRAIKEGRENQLVFNADDYDYHCWVTNMPLQTPAVEIIKFYRRRGHAENYIRDLKYGLDLRHYPCLKLNANKAYALIGALAYNLLRFVALKDNPTSPKFAKGLRFKFVRLPCQIVRHAGDVVFRFMDKHFKEVSYWLNTIKNLQLVSA